LENEGKKFGNSTSIEIVFFIPTYVDARSYIDLIEESYIEILFTIFYTIYIGPIGSVHEIPIGS
jgi:putative effector of murein hydrolase LrgA (UPF0299 family)